MSAIDHRKRLQNRQPDPFAKPAIRIPTVIRTLPGHVAKPKVVQGDKAAKGNVDPISLAQELANMTLEQAQARFEEIRVQDERLAEQVTVQLGKMGISLTDDPAGEGDAYDLAGVVEAARQVPPVEETPVVQPEAGTPTTVDIQEVADYLASLVPDEYAAELNELQRKDPGLYAAVVLRLQEMSETQQQTES